MSELSDIFVRPSERGSSSSTRTMELRNSIETTASRIIMLVVM